MRSSKKPFLIASFLCTWIVITYILWMRQASIEVDNHHKTMRSRLYDLEEGIKDEQMIHDELVKQLMVAIKSRDALQYQETLVPDTVAEPAHAPIIPESNKDIFSASISSSVSSSSTIKAPTSSDIKVIPPPSINQHDILDNSIKEIPLVVDNTPISPLNRSNLSAIRLSPRADDDFKGAVIPILVFACNRVSVRKCLDNLIEYRPNVNQFPIIVSQDCNDEATRNVILSYKDVTLISQPDQSDIAVPPKEKKFKGYYKIARHYGWALNTTFKEGFDYVVIVEDDLNIAPDFYEYFLGTHELLKNDSSLWCVSAWNDNGKVGNIDESQASLLYRTDFFPGLGWMLTKELWAELSVKWPKAFWDDWIRQPQQRKNRACIRPEISRTRTFGKVGVSNGLFFEKHLRYIKLSKDFVNYTKMNLTYLLKNNYDTAFLQHVYSSPVVTYEELRRGMVTTKDPVRIQYNTKDQCKRTAKLLGLMDDFKSGVLRTAYFGVVSLFYNSQRVYLAPNSNWKGYDLSWS